MKLYNGKGTHDDSPTCACEECRAKKGREFSQKIQLETLPWSSKKKEAVQTFVLRHYENGYAYVDKNILTMGWEMRC